MCLTFCALQTNQIKDPGTFNQITRSKPSRIRQKTVQPFQVGLLNPNRRAPLFSGKKVDRSTYAQSDSSGLRVVSNVVGENLLLRHSCCQKNKRSLCFDSKVDAFLELMRRFDEPHWWRVKHNIEPRISASQRGTSRGRWTNECYRKTLLPCSCNQASGQITACNDGQAQTAEPSGSAHGCHKIHATPARRAAAWW